MTRKKTRSEAAIEARLSELDPSSERFQVLTAARSFRASWVELGQCLTTVRDSDAFKEWGYTSFEAYCRRELNLKQDTASKLTRSFSFLRDHEPKVLQERGTAELPPLDVVDMLSQARERTNVSEEQFEAIRREVLSADEGAGAPPPTKQQVVKRFREVDPEAFRAPAKPKPAAGAGDNDLRKALLLAERLQSILEAQGESVSGEAVRGVKRAVMELRSRFEESRQLSA